MLSCRDLNVYSLLVSRFKLCNFSPYSLDAIKPSIGIGVVLCNNLPVDIWEMQFSAVNLLAKLGSPEFGVATMFWNYTGSLFHLTGLVILIVRVA